jgi:CPA2 family monovalent cation:H+ antiporter-2
MAVGLVPDPIGQQGLVIATLSMIAIPLLARVGARLGRHVARMKQAGTPPEPPPPGEGGRVVIAGYGRVGQLVGEMLGRHKIRYIAVDSDPGLVAAHRRSGNPVYFGDSTSPEFLRACGLDTARALVVTLDATRATEGAVRAARQVRPDLTVVARARDARHAMALYELGVDDAVPENLESSLQLSEAVLVDIGVPIGLVIASIHERRDEFRKVLKQTEKALGEEGSGEFHGRRTAGKRSA